MKKLDLYYIDLKYIRDLSHTDDNVMSISPQRGKQNRPFVGVVVLMNGRKYCIPLTSPKDKFKNKKSQVDFIKVFDEERRDENGQFKLIGVLNINNMIPVDDRYIKKVNLAVLSNDKPRNHIDTIENRANKVYDMVVNHSDDPAESEWTKVGFTMEKY